jgi:4'-phosphopantetheinyl transferase
MEVFWYQQRQEDVGRDDRWLSPWERQRLSEFRVTKRKQDWRLGRWTAKQAVAAYLGLSANAHALATIEIRPADSGAPEILLNDRPAAVSISLTHREGRSVCAVARAAVALGCDLELIESRSHAFLSDYFTAEEQAVVAGAAHNQHFTTAALLWSAKESTMKALREGLRIHPLKITVDLQPQLADFAKGLHSSSDGWQALRTSFEQQMFGGWWRREGQFVLTLVGEAECGPPARLSVPPGTLEPG